MIDRVAPLSDHELDRLETTMGEVIQPEKSILRLIAMIRELQTEVFDLNAKLGKISQERSLEVVYGESASPEFLERVHGNLWHDGKELRAFTDRILELSDEESKWTWVRNSDCKYISIRFDMRDGAFVMCDRERRRIDLACLEFQI